jgi:hypothetical protein
MIGINIYHLYCSRIEQKKHGITRHEPFYLMYGREAVLPIEFAVSIMQAQTPETEFQDDLQKRIHMITGRMNEDIQHTQDVIHMSQQQQKKSHDKNLKPVSFKIGDLVLLFKSQFRGKKKLQKHWSGPYYIHEVLSKGAYKLRTPSGDVLKVPVNSKRLKIYHTRSPP